MGEALLIAALVAGTYYGVRDGVIPAAKEGWHGSVWVAKEVAKPPVDLYRLIKKI